MQIYSESKQALDNALRLLSIDLEKFTRIHTVTLKREHLKYLWLLAECTAIACHDDFSFPHSKLQKLREAYEKLLASPLINDHQTKYSSFSVGLHEIDIRRTYQSREIAAQRMNEPELNSQSLEQSILFESPKNSGVEPGFEAFQTVDVLLDILQRFPSDEQRWKYLAHYQADIKLLCQLRKDHLPKYLVKSDYRKISNGMVTPEEEDLMRSNTIKNLYKKSAILGKFATFIYVEVKKRTFTQINKDSVREVLGNDVMRVYGVPAQQQFILSGRYDDNRLKLMLKALWVTGANILGPVYGSSDNKSYRAKPLLFKHDDLRYLADDSVKNLPECLPAMIILGDPDGIGSGAQNKLAKDGEFVCIDTGHAFDSDIVDQVSEFFAIKDSHFKNYTIFHSPRYKIMKGMLILAKQAGLVIPEQILKSYGSDFYEKYEKVVVGSDGKIFDDYILKFSEMKNEFLNNSLEDTDNSKCCEEIIADIIVTKQKALKVRDRLIEKFKKYLVLEQKAVDLIENIEKLFLGKDGTSLRSPNRMVLLQHLRVDETKIQWKVVVPTQQDNRRHFEFIFNSAESFSKIFQQLQDYAKNNKLPPNELEKFLSVDKQNNTLKFDFDYQDLSNFHSMFSEDKLIKYFFQTDYAYLLMSRLEKELQDILTLFMKHDIEVKITYNQNRGCYSVNFDHKEKQLPDIFMTLLNKYFDQLSLSGQLDIVANSSDITHACNAMRSVLFEYQRESFITHKIIEINAAVSELQNLDQSFFMKFERVRNKNEFSCHFGAHGNPVMTAIIKEMSFDQGELLVQDLLHIESKLRKMKEKYIEHISQIAHSSEKLKECNARLMSLLKLSAEPMQITSIERGQFKITFTKQVTEQYLDIVHLFLSEFNRQDGIYINFKEVSKFIQSVEEAGDTYSLLLEGKVKTLNIKINSLNSKIKSIFNIKTQAITVDFTDATSEIKLNWIDHAPALLEIRKHFFEPQPTTITSLEVALNKANNFLNEYEKELNSFKLSNSQLINILKLETELFTLNPLECICLLKTDLAIESQKISKLIHNITHAFQDQGSNDLLDLLKILNLHCNELLIAFQETLKDVSNSMVQILANSTNCKELAADVKFLNGKLKFKIQNCPHALANLLDSRFGDPDFDGFRSIKHLDKFDHSLTHLMQAYQELLSKEELLAEGFEFVDVEEIEDYFPILLQSLNKLASCLNQELNQKKDSEGSFMGIFSFFSTPQTPPKELDEIKIIVNVFLSKNDATLVPKFEHDLSLKLKEFAKYANDKMMILHLEEILRLCHSVTENKHLIKDNATWL